MNFENEKKEEQSKSNNDITCPFCGEIDFDLIGLKNHILSYCESFQQVSTLFG